MPQTVVDAAAAHAGVDLDTGEREAGGDAHDRVPGMVQLQLVHVLGPGTSAGARAFRFVLQVLTGAMRCAAVLPGLSRPEPDFDHGAPPADVRDGRNVQRGRCARRRTRPGRPPHQYVPIAVPLIHTY